MKALFDQVSVQCSRAITRKYSTSFSMGIQLLAPDIQPAIHSIYGFVRLADEIVDSFHDYDQRCLLAQLRAETLAAIHNRISINPIIHAFQSVVHEYGIEQLLIDAFLHSMEMDLDKQFYNQPLYEQYIYGSAQVVGLMCLRVFCQGNDTLYKELMEPAMRLGSAFQKVNFLRDIQNDFQGLGRMYFPNVNLERFSQDDKEQIERDIAADFNAAVAGIKKLPDCARKGVFLAYRFYKMLFDKIRRTPSAHILNTRIRVPNSRKLGLLFQTYLT
jgi:phytoene synthase